MSISKKLLQAAAGNAGESLYVEDVFSTYLYTGNGSYLAKNTVDGWYEEGGMIWFKSRSASGDHAIFDTARGFPNVSGFNEPVLTPNSNSAESFVNYLASNPNGFALDGDSPINTSGTDYVSWTFRKAEKFFDVVTYTGNGGVQNISHNLGAVPAVIIVKNRDNNYVWGVYTASTGNNQLLILSQTDAAQSPAGQWNNTTPTDTVFTVGNTSTSNRNGDTYVAYLFASDAGGFGDDGDENIIKCGSFTGNATVDVGFEPQWVMVKRTDNIGNWFIQDTMRGIPTGGLDASLFANLDIAESTTSNIIDLTATGFSANFGTGSETWIYIAIRRPMKTPESGTEVFQTLTYSGSGGDVTRDTNITVDALFSQRTTGGIPYALDRLRSGTKWLATSDSGTEGTQSTAITEMGNDYLKMGSGAIVNSSSSIYALQLFKRATGFFDVVAYSGDGASYRSIPHNLSAIPELIIIKRRTNNGSGDADAEAWAVWHKDLTAGRIIYLNRDAAEIAYATDSFYPSYSTFTSSSTTALNTGLLSSGQAWVNSATETYIAYLFASVAGVSKVGSYTGTGDNVDVDCGFSAGARFILIKRFDGGGTGDWYVYDSVRGIVAGNDPYLLLNSTAAEVTSTDYIDPLSSGFTVTSSAPAALNDSGGTYIFLAIA